MSEAFLRKACQILEIENNATLEDAVYARNRLLERWLPLQRSAEIWRQREAVARVEYIEQAFHHLYEHARYQMKNQSLQKNTTTTPNIYDVWIIRHGHLQLTPIGNGKSWHIQANYDDDHFSEGLKELQRGSIGTSTSSLVWLTASLIGFMLGTTFHPSVLSTEISDGIAVVQRQQTAPRIHATSAKKESQNSVRGPKNGQKTTEESNIKIESYIEAMGKSVKW